MDYNRTHPQSNYGSRPGHSAGPSRPSGYDREIREPRFDEYGASSSPALDRRHADSGGYTRQPDYLPSPRDQYDDSRSRDPAWGYPPPDSSYPRRPSSPPPPQYPSPSSYSSWFHQHQQHSPPSQHSLPPAPPSSRHWDDRRIYDSPRNDDRHFEPSTSWRQHPRGETTSTSRIHALLNPSSPGPSTNDRGWRSSAHDHKFPSLPPLPRDSQRTYSGDHYGHDHRGYGFSDGNNYRPSYSDRHILPLPRTASTYRPGQTQQPPSQRTSRPSAMGDYKRQRQSQNFPGPPPLSIHDRSIDSNRSYEASDGSPAVRGSRESEHSSPKSSNRISATQERQRSTDRKRASPERRIPSQRPGQEDADSDIASSGDESDMASSRSDISSRSSNASDVKPSTPQTEKAEISRAEKSDQIPSLSADEKSKVMSVNSLIAPSPVKSFTPATPMERQSSSSNVLKDTLEDDLRRNFALAQPEIIKKQQTSTATVQPNEPETSRLYVPNVGLSRTSTPNAFATASPAGRSVLLDLSHVYTPQTVTPTPEPTAESSVNGDAETDKQVKPKDRASPAKPKQLKADPPVSSRAHSPDSADHKAMVKQILAKAIIARRQFSRETPSQIVNPILISNLYTVESLSASSHQATSPDELVDEMMGVVLKDEEDLSGTRAVLAANFAEHHELLAEKTERLKAEYAELNEIWLAHCNALDDDAKSNVVEESFAVAGRTTRRSAVALGDTVRSDLEMEQILATLGNEDLTDPNHLAVRNVATIPDMISVTNGYVGHVFDDTNRLVDDPEVYYDARTGFYDWSPKEEAAFLERYAEYPKQFGIIADTEALKDKTPSQCVLYYYVHKKRRLVDFRSAVNNVSGKRKRGVRKGGKQKSNALLADIQKTDSQKPVVEGKRRRGRPPANPEQKAAAAAAKAAAVAAAAAREANGDGRPKRRKTLNSALALNKFIMVNEMQINGDGSVATESNGQLPLQSEVPAAPPKKKRGRKPKNPPPETPPAVTIEQKDQQVADSSDAASRRKSTTNSSPWSEEDKNEFLKLLSKYGKNFRQIAATMPGKTTVQVSNFYKSHIYDMGLEQITSVAESQQATPDNASAIEEGSTGPNRPSFQGRSMVPHEEIMTPLRPPEDSEMHLDEVHHKASEPVWKPESFPYDNHSIQRSMQSVMSLGQKPYMNYASSFQSGEKGYPRGMIPPTHAQAQQHFAQGSGSAGGLPTPNWALSPGLQHQSRPGSVPLEYPAPGSEHSYSQGQPHHPEVPGATDWPAEPPFPHPSRYSSFRAQLPRSASASDERMPVMIQHAPGMPFQSAEHGYFPYPLIAGSYPPAVPPYFNNAGGQQSASEQGSSRSAGAHSASARR